MNESNLYNQLGTNKSKNISKSNEVISLIEFLNKDSFIIQSLNKSLIKDFQKLLSLDLTELIEGIFSISSILEKIKNKDTNICEEIPTLKDFFKELTPILLQSIWEKSKNEYPKNDQIEEAIKNALYLAIEKEIEIISKIN